MPTPWTAVYFYRYVVEREDHDAGHIVYNVSDTRPGSYRFVCGVSDYGNPYAKHDAEAIAAGMNMRVKAGLEKLPNVRGYDDEE